MIANKNVKILISYKMQSSNTWQEINIPPKDYFDEKYHEEDEEIDINSISVFDHAIDYISLNNKEKISHTRLLITDIDKGKSKEINETYWNCQKNSLTERIDTDSEKKVEYYEMIITSLVQDDPNEMIWEVMRFSRKDELLSPIFHTLITENSENLVSERIII